SSEAADQIESGEPTAAEAGEPKRQAVLVGYGPRTGVRSRRRRPVAHDEPEPTANAAFQVPPVAATAADTRPLAKPPVRKRAKDLGVDLTTVAPTGPGGTISREDVQQAANGDQAVAPSPTSRPSPMQRPALRPAPSLEPGERETRIPVRGVRK